ncbi:hypothetical protein IT409_01315 [Candidatus Falkowbacteria bacterium]|nr:hypothetical protein [Candidatus Falkowbacteria bacterium]
MITYSLHSPLSLGPKDAKKLQDINKKFARLSNDPSMSFLTTAHDARELTETKKIIKRLRNQFSTLLVLGIGGSDLGAKTIINALSHTVKQPKQVIFAGDTSDPTHLPTLTASLDYKKTAVLVISKSGGTTETLATFSVILERFKKALGKNHAHHIFALTSSSGTLFEIAQAQGYEIISHGVVGGRFSVFSNVGLIPAGFFGINVDKIVTGAQEASTLVAQNTPRNNPAFTHACFAVTNARKHRNIAVLFIYSAGLATCAKWYTQLWAESLGKNGKGTTPLGLVGPTDQHSALQLLQDGPRDKFVTFVTTAQTNNLTVSKLGNPGFDSLLAGKSFNTILQAQYEGTKKALKHTPASTIKLEQLNEQTLGNLLMFFMLSVAYTAQLMNINAFDQPGVEESKKLTKKLLISNFQ